MKVFIGPPTPAKVLFLASWLLSSLAFAVVGGLLLAITHTGQQGLGPVHPIAHVTVEAHP